VEVLDRRLRPFPTAVDDSYIRTVKRILRLRLFATVVAFPAAFATPGVAVSHGMDHSEARHHALEHASNSLAADVLAGAPVVSDATGHDDDHQHPSLQAGVSGKGDGVGLPLIASRVELPAAQSDADPRTPVGRTRVRAHGAHAPPPNLRSPPTIFG
jgi:hypothetical protein